MNVNTSLNKYLNQFDLEQVYAKLVRVLVQKTECPIVLTQAQANKQVLAFVDKPYTKRKSTSGKDFFVSVIYDSEDPTNSAYLNRENRAGITQPKTIEAVFVLQLRIGKSKSGVRSINGVNMTDQNVLYNISNFIKEGLTLNNNNQDINLITLENIEYKNKYYDVNLELSKINFETNIEDEASLTGGDEYQYWVKNLTIQTIIITK